MDKNHNKVFPTLFLHCFTALRVEVVYIAFPYQDKYILPKSKKGMLFCFVVS